MTTIIKDDPNAVWYGAPGYVEPWPQLTPRDCLLEAIIGYLHANDHNIDVLVADVLKMANDICHAHGR